MFWYNFYETPLKVHCLLTQLIGVMKYLLYADEETMYYEVKTNNVRNKNRRTKVIKMSGESNNHFKNCPLHLFQHYGNNKFTKLKTYLAKNMLLHDNNNHKYIKPLCNILTIVDGCKVYLNEARSGPLVAVVGVTLQRSQHRWLRGTHRPYCTPTSTSTRYFIVSHSI